MVKPYKVNNSVKRIPNIKNIIAIASGKGGVGKSTVTVNLALVLQEQGAKVGILDADIYGPSIPGLLGVENIDKPINGDRFYPIKKFGIETLSIGYLISKQDAAIWRGPIVSNTFLQMLNQTDWPELDFLLIDLPPGTGDIQLTLTKKIPLTASIVVTTPQKVATEIAGKAVSMFKKLDIPILGVVENMGPMVCRHCGEHDSMFGDLGGKMLSDMYNVPLLGSIPLAFDIREGSDKGVPVVADNNHIDTDSSIRQSYFKVALKAMSELDKLEQDLSLGIATKIT